ncbi:amidase family protein [Paeniroseomonas aquatica]|uniref:amidase family protein n=1 Tax=Paeniroseomonas aquatica TaxID=373043 RepID=UPI00361F4FA2
MLARVGEVLLPEDAGAPALGPLLKANEAWINAAPATVVALAEPMLVLETLLGRAVWVDVAPEGLGTLYEHFRCVQAEEAWATLGSWVEATRPAFGPGVGERFAAARAMDPGKAAAGRSFRRAFRARLQALLAGGAVLAYPTSPVPAPKLDASLAEQNAVRERSMGVTAIAGLCGLPEVSLPLGRAEGTPVGLSLVTAAGRDRALLALAGRLAAALGRAG